MADIPLRVWILGFETCSWHLYPSSFLAISASCVYRFATLSSLKTARFRSLSFNTMESLSERHRGPKVWHTWSGDMTAWPRFHGITLIARIPRHGSTKCICFDVMSAKFLITSEEPIHTLISIALGYQYLMGYSNILPTLTYNLF